MFIYALAENWACSRGVDGAARSYSVAKLDRILKAAMINYYGQSTHGGRQGTSGSALLLSPPIICTLVSLNAPTVAAAAKVASGSTPIASVSGAAAKMCLGHPSF